MKSNNLRTVAISNHNQELINRLMQKPEVVGIIAHGSFSNSPRHATDSFSDLDLTVIIDCGNNEKIANSSDPRTYIPWLNFKSYQALEDSSLLEVDMYYFDMANDIRSWNNATREGYAYSATLVYDPTGNVKKWLEKKYELTPAIRNDSISKLMHTAKAMLASISLDTDLIDKKIILTKVVKLLVEVVFYINWEYPPDLKWRVSGSHVLEWTPKDFVFSLGGCNNTLDIARMMCKVSLLFGIILEKLEEEGFELRKDIPVSSSSNNTDRITQIARLFTRIDKYSAHSVRKCIRRGLPWNAHDLVSEGVENAIDIIYAINDKPIPKENKYANLKYLKWKPHNWERFFYQATLVTNYENANNANARSEALRQLFNSIKAKIEEMGIFSTSSLYTSDFMGEDLFSETSPYMKVFKGGMYFNRQQERDTFAEIICKKVNLPIRQKNILFGMCSHYLLSDENELLSLKEESIHPYYLPTWKEVVKQLSK